MIETRLISWVSKLAPWLTTLPTAFAIGHAVWSVIGWPAWIAMITALAVESMGIAVTNTALELYAWNQSKRQRDPEAPLWLALLAAAAYYVAAVILTAVLERNLTLALFPVLSAAAAGTLALRADQAARADRVAEEKAQAKNERAQLRDISVKIVEPERKVAQLPAYTCATCGAAYEKQTSLAAHMRRHRRKVEVK